MIDKVRRRMPWSKSPSNKSNSDNGNATTNSHELSSNRPRFPSYASDTSSNTVNGNRPRLPSTGDNSYSSTMSIGSSRTKRVSAEEERLTKSRRAVDSYLKKISNVTGKHYSLNRDTGMCYFPYQRFIVVIEIPADHPGSLYMYTCVCKLETEDQGSRPQNLMAIMQVAMELNYMQHRTRGATLGMEQSEVNLCYSTPIASLSPAGLKQVMDDFLTTTTEVHAQLERAKLSSSTTTSPVSSPDRSISTKSSTRSLSPPMVSRRKWSDGDAIRDEIPEGDDDEVASAATEPTPKPLAYQNRSSSC